ncbi:MAG: caspase family protein [Cyclobacteriaceae bacterium]
MSKLLTCIVFSLMISGAYAQDLPVELRIQGGHDHLLSVVNVSPDGKWLASGGYDRTIILWDVATGRELRRLACESFLQALEFSPDGKLLGSVSDEGSVVIYEVATGQVERTIPRDGVYYRSLRFLPDGKRFITSVGNGTAMLWSLDKEEPLSQFEGDRFNCIKNCQHAMDVSPNGKWMIISNTEGDVTLWNISKQTPMRTYRHYPDNSHSTSDNMVMKFLPDSKSFIVGSEGEGILQWSVTDNENPTVILEPQIIGTGLSFMLNDLDVNQTGDKLAVLYFDAVKGKFQRDHNRNFHVYDLTTNEWVASHEMESFESMAFSPVSDDIYVTNDATPELLNPMSGETLQSFSGFLTNFRAPYWIMRAAKKHIYLPPETVLERVGNQVIAWNLRTGKPTQTYTGHTDLVLGIAASADQTMIATGGADQQIRVVDKQTGALLWSREMQSPVFTVVFSPNGEHLVTAHITGRIVLWDARTGHYIRDLYRIRDWYYTPMDIAFTSTGLITWGGFLMDTTTREQIVEFDSHEERVHAVSTSKDGKALLTSGWDGRVVLRELYYGGKVTELYKDENEEYVYCATFSPDEKSIAIGGSDNKIRLISMEGKVETVLEGHSSAVTSITFTEDGKYLVSGSEDGSVKVWNLEVERVIYTHVMLDEKRWTTQVPSGHFYATQEGMETMFFVRGTQIYALDQFFEEFYQPQLTVDLLSANYQERDKLDSQVATQPPPEVKIAFPGSGKTEQTRAEILVRVTDQGGGIDEVRLTHNGKLVVSDVTARLNKSGRSQALKYHVDLVPGENIIRATAFSTSRIESKTEEIRLTRPADEPTAACYVVAVGINRYKNPRLNLNYAVDDAKSIVKLIETNSQALYTNVETHMITDEEATREKIIEKLVELSAVIKPTDVFYFFYAGHGSLLNENFYFIPTNSTRLYEEAGLQAEALYVGDLVNYLKDIKALKQVLFIDACHSGGSTAILASRGAGEEKALAQLSRSAGVHILAAAGSDQAATEFAELGHGLFTYAVLEALSGKADGAPADNKVTVYELKSFLDDQVPEYSLKYKNTPQYPNTFSIGHDFPIVLFE